MSDSSSFIKNVVLRQTCSFAPFPDDCVRWTGIYLSHPSAILLLLLTVPFLLTYRESRGLIHSLEHALWVYIDLLKITIRLLSNLWHVVQSNRHLLIVCFLIKHRVNGLIYPSEIKLWVCIGLLKIIICILSNLWHRMRLTQSEYPQILGPSNWKNVEYKLPSNIQVPSEFICPITQEIMKSPVLLSDGHAYEEAVAVRLLQSGVTSPFTRESLRLLYIRNTAQRRAIIDWVEDNNGSVLWQ